MKRVISAALVLAFGAVGLTGCEEIKSQRERMFETCIKSGGSWIDRGARKAECILPDYEGEEK